MILLPVDKKVSFNGNKKALVMKDLHAKKKKMTTNKKKKKEQYAFKINKWYKLARFYNLLFVRYFDLKSPITSIYIFFSKINYSITMIMTILLASIRPCHESNFKLFDWKCFTCG